jgi:hypothetical protein
LQQASQTSGKSATYNADIDYLVDYVLQHATNPNVKLGWHMTWAYQTGSSHQNFPDYDKSQRKMYDMICKAVQDKILPNDSFSFVIPSGTAIQNARAEFGDVLNVSDGYHLNNTGCYIAAATWLKAIFGWDVASLTAPYTASSVGAPTVITEASLAKIVASVNAAVKSPFESAE